MASGIRIPIATALRASSFPIQPIAGRLALPRPAVIHRKLVGYNTTIRIQRRGYVSGTYNSSQPRSRMVRSLLYLWRATYMSAIAGTMYLGWCIYDVTHPPEQQEPDPSKKTLVVLGSGWGSVSLLKSLDTSNYNVIVVSPRNYFLFTPLLPSCPTGTVEHRSIIEPLREIIRHKRTAVRFYEAEATKIDHENRVVTIQDLSEVRGDVSKTEIPFDYLIVAVGAENATFGIPGVKEHSCFLKEITDTQKIRTKVMDCVESALFKDQTLEEQERLLHMVVVGGGPTGVEFAAELADFFEEDLKKWVPEIKDKYHVTLIEALPNVLPTFSRTLIEYTEKTFKTEGIDVRSKTMVKKVAEKNLEVVVTKPDGTKEEQVIPYGTLIWAAGNAVRPLIRDMMQSIPQQRNSRRGLAVNEYLVVDGTEGIWALGDCSATKYAPTAQVANQQGKFLARLFNSMAHTQSLEQDLKRLEEISATAKDSVDKETIEREIQKKDKAIRRVKQLSPFEYSHQGSLAYIGMDKAVADITWWNGNIASGGGGLTYLFWRSAYVSMCFSTRNRILVVLDWVKVKLFGRDVSRE